MRIAIPFTHGPVNLEMRRRIRRQAQGAKLIRLSRGDQFNFAYFVWSE